MILFEDIFKACVKEIWLFLKQIYFFMKPAAGDLPCLVGGSSLQSAMVLSHRESLV